jgi:prepilin signal peptidase PulO-like enzyme (type II secretory pathway)
LSWFENVPLFSFMFLRGRCRHCSKPISWQYPLVEASTGILFAIWVFRFPQWNGTSLLSGVIFLSFLVLLTTADIKWLLLPHSMNNLFVACGLLSFWIRRGEWGSKSLLDSLLGFTVFGAVFLFIEAVWPARLGGGDIKMSSGLGAWLGLEKGFEALTLAYGLGALLGIAGMLLGKTQLKSKIPFGPFLALGGLASACLPSGVLGWNW